jgi:protein-tyrosine phosphatase
MMAPRVVRVVLGNILAIGAMILLQGTPLWAQADAEEASPPSSRSLLEGQPNFRDLGGYKTSNGRVVKRGLVFRSGELPRLTDQDMAELKRLGIQTVVNFLTETEIEARGEDRLPDGVETVSLPIAGGDDNLAVAILEARQKADFSQVPVETNADIHRLAIRDARKEYGTLLRAIADPANRPIVFHCSHGVHRTGTAAAILLSALGVPWETARRDYLLSNDCRKEEIERRLAELRNQAAKNRGVSPEDVDMTNANAFYILQGDYIDASLDETVKRYGSMENYIRDGLGVSDEEVERLQDALLE